MRAPERIETERLVLRRPRPGDAEEMFARFTSDPEVTRFMSWPRHTSIEHTHSFLAYCDAQWESRPSGPYLIESRERQGLLGSTGLGFESAGVAQTGYVLARDSWGSGYATEALRAMVALGRQLRLNRLCAGVHEAHRASIHVLEKCGFVRDGPVIRLAFPNLPPEAPHDALNFVYFFSGSANT